MNNIFTNRTAEETTAKCVLVDPYIGLDVGSDVADRNFDRRRSRRRSSCSPELRRDALSAGEHEAEIDNH